MPHRTASPPAVAGQLPAGRRAPARAVAKSPSYAAYGALMAHLKACHDCAHATRPCTTGTALRQAWKAARAA